MSSKNRVFTMTKGAYGTQMGFSLYDAAGVFTITGTVTIYVVSVDDPHTNVITGVCNTGGPFTIEGKTWPAKYAFSNADMDLAAGTYLMRFTHGTIAFPTDPAQWFGKIIINPSV